LVIAGVVNDQLQGAYRLKIVREIQKAMNERNISKAEIARQL
jgi:hypothetical protein